MSKSLRISLVVVAVVVSAAALLWTGIVIGRAASVGYFGANEVVGYGPGRMMGGVFRDDARFQPFGLMGPGMMGQGSFGTGPGMMGQGNFGVGPGMMGQGNFGMGPGMMFGVLGAGAVTEPLELDAAERAVEGYLDTLGDSDLALGEIMIFENHAYAQIVEADSGIGALEVLIDPLTLAVYPEPGPNMMWNLKYGHMGGQGMMGMMGSWGRQDLGDELSVSSAEAIGLAQQYLDRALPGSTAADEADPFYGYYTLHYRVDGEVAGMLSVNGYSGQVFLHTWHGEFIEMSEAAHD